jgi:chemotaxis protein CheD
MIADERVLGRPLAGFEHVQRFYDPRLGKVSSYILPGEYFVTDGDDVVSTVLGSCVAACIWDPVARLGGMNHFMIPGTDANGSMGAASTPASGRYGIFAMELLVNAILKHGGDRSRLLVKLVGGGYVTPSSYCVGDANVAFAREYVTREGFRLVAEHVGGHKARRLIFHPRTGRSKVSELSATVPESFAQREQDYAATVDRTPAGAVEIF